MTSTTPDTGASFGYGDFANVNEVYAVAYSRARLKDKAWFERYPHRRYRLRKLTDGEQRYLQCPRQADGYPARMLVEQLQPGFRRRELVYAELSTQAPDEILEGFIRLHRRAQEQGYVGELHFDDLRAEMGMAPTEQRH